MSYQLGIDFGTTFTAAAVRRADGEPEVVPLGARDGTVSSVLHLARDERVTVGEAAAGLAGIDPTRVVRALKRHVGEPDPVVVGGHPWTAEELSARLLRWVVDRVVEQEGDRPARIALAHPLSWDARTLERLAAAAASHGLGVTFVAEPVAVVHADGSAAPGDTVAVCDVGGGRVDVTVLRREGGDFAVLGRPETIADLGGLDLDDLIWQHVRAELSDDVPPVARVRRACTRAKETLSTEDEVVVRIRRGELRGAVRLDRATFEGMIAPHVDRTVAALQRTVESAGVEPGRSVELLLVGGSARIPLVARTVADQLGRVPTVHTAADLVARGALLALPTPGVTVDEGDPVDAEAPTVLLAVPALLDAPTTPFHPVTSAPETEESTSGPAAPAPRRATGGGPAVVLDPGGGRTGRRSLSRTLVGVGAVIVAALVLVALFRPDGPLDPPLDPVAGDEASQTVAPAVGAPTPTDAIRTDLEADPPTAAVRPARGLPDPRPSVTTTPPAAPRVVPVEAPPTADGIRAQAPPTAMTPPVPPTPVAPVV